MEIVKTTGVQRVEMVSELDRAFQYMQFAPLDEHLRTALIITPREAHLPSDASDLAYQDNPVLYNEEEVAHLFAEKLGALEEKDPESLIQFFFLPDELKGYIYNCVMGEYQATMSAPVIAACMLQAGMVERETNDARALEVGSGMGYILAVLTNTQRYKHIYGVEMREKLAQTSRETFGYLYKVRQKKISVAAGDGYAWIQQHGEKKGPFDTILISCGVTNETLISEFLPFLAVEGKLVAPVQTGFREPSELFLGISPEKKAYVGQILASLGASEEIPLFTIRQYQRLSDTDFVAQDILPNTRFVPFLNPQ